MLLGAITFALLVANGPARAQRHNAVALSPDHRYVAVTVQGEAECSYLYVLKVKHRPTRLMMATLRRQAKTHAGGVPGVPKPRGTQFWRMDVDSFIWIPQRPHELLYGESEIYGDGVVALLNPGRKARVLARPRESEFQITLKSYDSTQRRLTYEVNATRGVKEITKTRQLTVPPR